MSVVIELPKELEERLAADASLLNLSLVDYALQILDENAGSKQALPTNGRELVKYWRERGLIGTLSSDESTEEISRRLRYQSEHRSVNH